MQPKPSSNKVAHPRGKFTDSPQHGATSTDPVERSYCAAPCNKKTKLRLPRDHRDDNPAHERKGKVQAQVARIAPAGARRCARHDARQALPIKEQVDHA